MDPKFWQLLLTAELPFARRQAVVARAGTMPRGSDWLRFFREAPELSPADRSRLSKANPMAASDALELGAQIVERRDLPERCRETEGTPAALFIWGQAECLLKPVVGIVGTRGASTYGKAAARKFAEMLAQEGVTIASGGAQGIDAAAHEGAIAAGGETACVMACGIDRVYPASHRTLFERIRRQGCLVSQFPAGWNPRSDSFVHRNATIAALSDAVLVVEAPERSGALITVNRANEFGRPVYVVPGSISTLSFKGSHALIRDGATLVDHPDQILEDLGIRPGLRLSAAENESKERKQILGSLGADPLGVEKIAQSAGMEASEVLSELTMLELDGKVIRGPGGYLLAP